MFLGATVCIALVMVALVVVACGGGTTATTAAPTATTAGASATTAAAVDAAALFAQYCSGCHKQVPGGTADRVKTQIENGGGSMPAFGSQLSAEQITALVNYVVSGGK